MITLTPAYGRDYKSKRAALEAFEEGYDFIINDITHQYDGKPATKSQLVANGERQVKIRYNKLLRVFVHNLV